MKFKKEQVRQAYLKKLMEEHKKYSKPKLADGGALERLITPKDQELVDQYNAMNNPDELQKSLPGNIQALKEIQQEIKSPIEEIKPANASLPDIQVSPKLENEQKIDKEQPSITEEVKPKESLFKQILMEKISQPKQDVSAEYTKLLGEIDKQKQEAKSEKQKADWMSALSMISSNLGKTLGTDVGPAMKFEPGISEENILQNKLNELKLKEMLQPKSVIDDKLLGYLASSERLDFAREKEAMDVKENERNFKLREDEKKEIQKKKYLPSDKEIETMSAADTTISELDRFEKELLPSYSKYAGKYAPEIQERLGWIGLEQSPDYVKGSGALTNITASYRKWISGTASSEREAEALERFTPTPTDTPAQLKAKIQNMRDVISLGKKVRQENLEKYGLKELPEETKLELNKEKKYLSDRDKQALEWAEANPDKPQAAKIKAKLGL